MMSADMWQEQRGGSHAEDYAAHGKVDRLARDLSGFLGDEILIQF